MRSVILATTMSLALAGCANGSHVGRGAGIGAAGGAVLGAVVPGINPVEGAAIGAAGGAVVGAIQDGNRDRDRRRWYRDDRGNRYWVDRDGRRHYD